jgi:hypothetical protein
MCPAARHCGHLFFGPQLAGGHNWCRCCGLTLLASLQSLPRRSFSRNHRSTSTSVTCLANCSVGTPRIFLAISRQVGGPLIHYCCPADGPHVDDRLLCQGSPRQLVGRGFRRLFEIMVVTTSIIDEHTKRQRPMHRGSSRTCRGNRLHDREGDHFRLYRDYVHSTKPVFTKDLF